MLITYLNNYIFIFRTHTLKCLEVKRQYVHNSLSNSSGKNHYVCIWKEQDKASVIKTLPFGESGKRIFGNSLHYFCNFPVSQKLFQNKVLEDESNCTC